MSDPRCPKHGVTQVWKRKFEGEDVECCFICGTPMCTEQREQLEQTKPEPVTIRTFAVYREHANTTDGNHPLPYYAGGLCEEAGEIWREIKRNVWHGHPLNRDKLREEIGDALWLLDQLAKHLGFPLEECATDNVVKLSARYPEGFSEERSRNREDSDV
jgi:NTP pyrophosphatase (non-canonical NTP hydrolase)